MGRCVSPPAHWTLRTHPGFPYRGEIPEGVSGVGRWRRHLHVQVPPFSATDDRPEELRGLAERCAVCWLRDGNPVT